MDRIAHEQIVNNRIDSAIDTMFPHGAGQAHHTRVRHWLEDVAQVAFREGGSYATRSLLTVEDVAAVLGVTPRRVRAIAKNLHEPFGIGWHVPGTNQWLFRPEELETLRPDEL